MRPVRLLFAAIAFAALTIVSAQAQAPARPAGTQPAPTTGSAPATGTARVAVIDSGAFSDDKGGIARVVNAVKQVETQFQPQRTELQNLQNQYSALVSEIEKTAAVANPQALAQKREQAEQLQLQIKRKQEDAQAAFQKRMGEVLDPLQQDVYNSLQAFAQARGISVIIDASRVPLIYVADSVDITKEFVAEYNRTHPATASIAAPTTGRPAPATPRP